MIAEKRHLLLSFLFFLYCIDMHTTFDDTYMSCDDMHTAS